MKMTEILWILWNSMDSMKNNTECPKNSQILWILRRILMLLPKNSMARKNNSRSKFYGFYGFLGFEEKIILKKNPAWHDPRK